MNLIIIIIKTFSSELYSPPVGQGAGYTACVGRKNKMS